MQVICRPPARQWQWRPAEAGVEDVPSSQTRHTGVEAGTGAQRLLSRVNKDKHLDIMTASLSAHKVL